MKVLGRLSNEQQAGHRRDASEPGDAEDERVRQLLEGLAELRRPEQDVFVLCVWQDLSYEEAALALGIPVGTVRSRLSRARERLRELAEGNRT